MAEKSYAGEVQFSDENLLLSVLSGFGFPLYRFVISDDAARVEGRWRLLRALLPSRSCEIDKVVSARLRGTFIIVNLPDDAWWTISAPMRCNRIVWDLEAKGVPVTKD